MGEQRTASRVLRAEIRLMRSKPGIHTAAGLTNIKAGTFPAFEFIYKTSESAFNGVAKVRRWLTNSEKPTSVTVKACRCITIRGDVFASV